MRSLSYLMITSLMWFMLNCGYAAGLKEISQDLSDSVITTKITTKFTQQSNLNPLKILVSTQDGVVTLRGYVKDKQAFVDALRIATTTQGVKSIETDDLEIKTVNTAFTDAYITAKIEAAILKAKVWDDESIPLVGINASTMNGVVTLVGELKTNHSVQSILKRASAVRGVKRIISKLHTGSVDHN